VLTRLHARYGKDGAPNDLVFKAAPPIAGGREERGEGGRLEERAHPDEINNFQGRYAIRHAWTGPIQCANPVRGVWGGPPGGDEIAIQPATKLGLAPRGQVQLTSLLAQDVPELGVKAGPPLPGGGGFQSKAKGCGCAAGGAGGLAGGGALAGLVLVLVRRRRRS
jgi:MYXO-CTERM domain-containing protein